MMNIKTWSGSNPEVVLSEVDPSELEFHARFGSLSDSESLASDEFQ